MTGGETILGLGGQLLLLKARTGSFQENAADKATRLGAKRRHY